MQGVSILKNMMDVTKQWAVIGYSLRFHPALQIIKSLLSEIGTPLYARAEVGQYLPDWHPTENYKHWYMAHEDQGGGALLDLSHELDYMMWLFGNMLEWHGTVKTISNLKIDSDDIAEVQIHYYNLKIGSIHMDLLDRAYNRSLRIIGSEATLKWEWKQSIELLQGDTHTYYGYNHNRNVQFIEEMKTFIQSVQAGYPLEPFATLADGEEILRIVLDLKEQNGR
jgi:predicted dehydrogenase